MQSSNNYSLLEHWNSCFIEFMYRIYLRISRPLKIESVCRPKSLTRV